MFGNNNVETADQVKTVQTSFNVVRPRYLKNVVMLDFIEYLTVIDALNVTVIDALHVTVIDALNVTIIDNLNVTAVDALH